MKAIIRIFVLFVAILVLVAVFAVWEGLREEGEPTTTTAASVCQHRDSNDDSRCDTCDDDYTDGIDVVATTTAAVTTAPVGNIMYNSAKTAISLGDDITPELFGASCYYSNGTKAQIAVTFDGTFAAGQIIKVHLSAGPKRVDIENVRVYGEPHVEFEEFFAIGTDLKDLATVTDSFGEPLQAHVSYDGSLISEGRVTVTVRATDPAGNAVEKQRSYIVGHTYHAYENGVCTVCEEQAPVYTRDGDYYIYFGEYPQSLKADNVTLEATPDERGYYRGSDGFYYAKVTAEPYGTGYTFSTGTAITQGAVYYFKVEPIRWRILTMNGNDAFLLCDSIIANMAYQPSYYLNGNYYTTANGAPSGTYANSYEHSEVRRWLNAEFYLNSFTDMQRELILETVVDNSLQSTGYNANPCAGEDTEDRIFLLSYAEATNSMYGFASAASGSTNNIRRRQTSDYARATGAYAETDQSDGIWLLRSPTNASSSVRQVNGRNGKVEDNGYIVYKTAAGIIPALWITLE